ncbi:TetR/AcrR family transcriptional regulator [Williamsia phyllosphaerae]|uniref:TetR family transcriptional regulator n=1 Tax=Williamsia phyllosphaerae TaxID=885042 RepID=A0ABQ1U6Z5_9NOCA|nr:TetR/AcrR family transcriptional regulator [Williamsia phyllosphaerae]GGF10399.1 TetR family transcriptional regulator [Williamsia phyllosphaerae]
MPPTDTPEPPRARMVRSAARMIRERGVTGVGLRQIAADADGPRGSLQRYFPGGKTQVLLEAIDLAVDDFAAGTRAAAEAETLPDAVRMIVASWREVLTDSDFTVGCPIASFVVDVSSVDPLRERADERFSNWRKAIAAIYRRFGYDRSAAWDEAILVISALEGAALVARAARDIEAIDVVEKLLVDRLTSSA